MLTKANLLSVASVMVAGAQAEIVGRNLNDAEKFAVRGAVLRGLDNLWYDEVPNKVKEQFNYDRSAFINAVWTI